MNDEVERLSGERLAELLVEEERNIQAALSDSTYMAGVRAGWNAANSDDPRAEKDKIEAAYAGRMKPFAARAKRLATLSASPPVGRGDAPATAKEMWQEILEYDDRTSPEEYPEMVLITFDEFADFIKRASSNPPANTRGEREKVIEALLDKADEAYAEGDSHLMWRTYDNQTDEDIRDREHGTVVFSGDAIECQDFMHRTRLKAALLAALAEDGPPTKEGLGTHTPDDRTGGAEQGSKT